ncbi:uncharacterized protein LOC134195249 [Corticium candelabrum]|uniref:uncharacterized protein LOC134195249 n=1 Tax=Corticium candelabrum TaxID=121492 RepID=UPI002E2693E7|nr:uncharacterized protein LOC134195249 [Corticium candelabrum]
MLRIERLGMTKVVCLLSFLIGFGFGFLTAHEQSQDKSNVATSQLNRTGLCPPGGFPLLLVSLDGFRSDYLNRGCTPHLLSIVRDGVQAKFLQSQFPTKTFPNHYSIITGLYPESHGIVHNRFYDPALGDTFYIGGPSSHNPDWWNEGEPIWVTATNQGLKTAAYFWPGSDVEIRNSRPDYWFLYNSSVSWSDRVNTVLQWLDLPDSNQPSFITLYVEEPDHTGHISGPESHEVNIALTKVDSLVIKPLINGLKERGIYDCVNMIIVSDHGMTAVNTDRVLFADKCFALSQASFIVEGPVSLLYSAHGVKSTIFVNRDYSQCLNKNARFYLKEDLPKRFHYANNKRISSGVVLANLGWRVLLRLFSAQFGVTMS